MKQKSRKNQVTKISPFADFFQRESTSSLLILLAAILGLVIANSNLSDAYFGYANLEGADLRGADLRGANFKYASVRGANFCGVDLSSTHISPEQLSLAKTNWRTVMPNGKRGMW